MSSEKKKKRSSAELVYDKIKKKILDLEIAPGESLSEVGISSELGVSRTPVREAFSILESEGLVVVRNRRKYVAFLTLQELYQIFEIKIVLESFVARKAAELIDEEKSKGLEDIVDGMKKLLAKVRENPDVSFYEEWKDLNVSFHEYLYLLSGNKRAKEIIDNLNLQWNRWRMGVMAMQWRLPKNIGEHIELGEAVLLKDQKKAERLMTNHLKDLLVTVSDIVKTFQLK